MAKLLADEAIADCAELTNLAASILECKELAAKASAGSSRPPEFWLRRGLKFLERYAFMIIFAAYALAEAPQGFTTPFSTWLRQNWSLKRGLNNLTLE